MVDLQDSFTIKIKQFEGPFDLLLFFIERDELDILDIPISKITSDFLNYIHHLEILNLDVASEFILVAATLMKIKSKMLLPRPILNDEGQEIDPRQELTQKLLEYKQFKDTIQDLEILAEQRSLISSRGNTKTELKSIAEVALIDSELESLTLYRLFRSFENVLKGMEIRNRQPRHLVFRFEYSLEEQREYILSKIKVNERTSFSDLFGELLDRLHAIITFLSLLELINAQKVHIIPGLGTNNFWISESDED